MTEPTVIDDVVRAGRRTSRRRLARWWASVEGRQARFILWMPRPGRVARRCLLAVAFNCARLGRAVAVCVRSHVQRRFCPQLWCRGSDRSTPCPEKAVKRVHRTKRPARTAAPLPARQGLRLPAKQRVDHARSAGGGAAGSRRREDRCGIAPPAGGGDERSAAAGADSAGRLPGATGGAAANPKGIAASSPRLRGTSYLGSRFENEFNRNAVAASPFATPQSIPNIFLVPFDFVSL